MLSEFGIAKRVWSRCTALLVMAGFAACVDDSVAPAPEATPPTKSPRVIGFAELTFTGIGTSDLSSSMLVAPTLEALEELRAQRDRSGDLRDFVAQDFMLPRNQDGSGNGTIQLALDQSQEFPPVGGVRYLNATYSVRNAQLDSAAGSGYDTERTNLTFLGVSSNNTVNQTAVRRLLLDGGTPAPAALALEVLPTDLVTATDTPVVAAHPDVLQIFREAEVGALTPPAGVTSVFPYGFVVRRVGSSTSRTLPASPPEGTFHGIVDFGFSIPAQPSSDQDPQTLSVLMLAVDDSETQLTQGPLEQRPEATEALRQLATSLNADTVTLLPGGTLPGDTTVRTLCSVRTAGTPTVPTAHLVNVDWTFESFNPNPYATDGSASFISSTTAFEATFSEAADGGGPETFTVRGSQSGPAFRGDTYTGNRSSMIGTPAGSFFPGEEIEVALTNALSCPQPTVARYGVETTAGSDRLSLDTSLTSGNNSSDSAIADFNGDGILDFVVSQMGTDDVSVYFGSADSTFSGPTTVPTAGTDPVSVAIGDLDGNGTLDIATANIVSGNISVIFGDGTGGFSPAETHSAARGTNAVAIGDLNGNGILDIAVANVNAEAGVFLGNGDGSFQPHQPVNTGSGQFPYDVAIADLNNDGVPDLAVSERNNGDIIILLGNGDGTFQGPSPFPAGTEPEQIATGDVNNDGHVDLTVNIVARDSLAVLLNDGSGNFTDIRRIRRSDAFVRGLDIGDVNGDGNLDIVAGTSDIAIGVFIGDGTGNFANPEMTTIVDIGPRSVSLGDLFGNDGILDAVVAIDDGDSVSLLAGVPPQ